MCICRCTRVRHDYKVVCRVFLLNSRLSKCFISPHLPQKVTLWETVLVTATPPQERHFANTCTGKAFGAWQFI